MPRTSTYIVTGGAGFVGSNLAAALQKNHAGHVLVVDDCRTGSFANLVEACERHGQNFRGEFIATGVEGLDWQSLLKAAKAAAVFHLGAITDTTVMNEREMLRVNAESFPAIAESCAAAKTPLVYASSAATYGSPDEGRRRVPFPESSAGKPNNVYGFSKWLMECTHARINASTKATPWIVGLRYFNVFGPGESRKGKMASMIYQIATQMLAGKHPRIFTDGEQARDQVSVDDVVACTLAGAGLNAKAKKKPAPGVYNLGSGATTSFNQIIAAVREGLGITEKDHPTEYFPMPTEIRAFYQDYTCADMSSAAKGLGFTPQHPPRQAMVKYARLLADDHHRRTGAKA
jgi:ADP-L-glycero-D-manno-heptose 6-epimerase